MLCRSFSKLFLLFFLVLLLPISASATFAQNGAAYCFGDGTGTPCPCAAFGAPGEGCLNSGVTEGATLTASGNAYTLNDTFQLDVIGVPGSKPGLILRGASQLNGGFGSVVGDGLLCVGGQSARSQVQVTVAGSTSFANFQGSGFGTSNYGIGVPTNYQFWYRDPGNTCSGSGFNFSNAWSAVWQPGSSTVPIAGMVQIPAGSFLMGSNAASGAPYYNSPNQQPVHSVTISEAFWMSETEITQSQYQALMGSNPSYFSGPNLPVEQVTWHDAVAYCAALTAQEQAAGNVASGFEYRLPSEAEWEYACRAGTTTEFNVGPDLFCGQARFAYSEHSNSSCSQSSTVAVGGYAPNAIGLYDMHGNVWEWCLDSYASYSSAAVTDPFVSDGNVRVLRGGSWYYNSRGCRSAVRGGLAPFNLGNAFGFRVVLSRVLVP
jgi:formylglycine-generating enzyme required for sulfatase activity